jgi:putative nucleotidyltransferase with HDIG domain
VQPLAADKRSWVAGGVGLVGTALCALWATTLADERLLEPLTVVVAIGALLANIAAASWDGQMLVSGSFVALMLALAFLGPAPAFAIVVIAELGAWAVDRYRPAALGVNIFGTAAPLMLASYLFAALISGNGADFYFLLAGLAASSLALNFLIVATLSALLHGEALIPRLRAVVQFIPALGINVVLSLTAASIYASVGLGAVIFILVSILAFSYMARLVVMARERTRQYAALSWGVLSGLIRTLDLRDPRAARHAAAVAAFSRDIAETCGMSPQECELAHTAGLLHDIGRFGLSDRVMEKGRTLAEQDWEGIRAHPALGADLLRDLGVYGPVAQIVRAHHERIDGRGYPDGLAGEEIPELAKIVAVAEIYDTLTADDTYRTAKSSFEALTELRRVSGSQVEGRYVEALAELLAGRGVEYRHADKADFDSELDVERRIGDAVGVEPAEIEQPPADEVASAGG